MFKTVALSILCVFLVSWGSVPAEAAWPWSSRQDLVTINGITYSPDDYIHWRENLTEQEKGITNQSDLEPFIEWELLAQEGHNMELDQTPALKRKNEVFKRFRIRMQFKYDEVDSKIRITEQDMRARFEKDYDPVSHVTFLYFRSEDKAEEARQQLNNDAISFEDLKDRPEEEGGPHQSRQKIYYPYQLAENPNLNEIINNLGIGDVSKVYPMASLSILVHLDKMEPAEIDLYEKNKKEIRTRLSKEQSTSLTADLIKSLWDKYQVKVDEELFAKAGSDLKGDILGQPIARTNKADIPFFLLIKDIRKEHSLRKIENWPEEKRTKLYRGLLEGMIIEYLFTWESYDRHYEEKAPLKWSIAHQQEKNLIKELEHQLLEPRATLSDDEIMQYYQTHTDEFTKPDIVSVTSLDGEQELVGKIWQEISRGADFTEVANKYEAKLSAQKDIDLEKLTPKFRSMIEKLDEDEVSEPFEVENGRYALVKLLDRKVGEVLPLESVRERIIEKLRPGKFQKVKDEYIKKLFKFSDIDVNQAAWDKLVAEQKN